MHAAAGDAQFSLRDGPVDLGAFSYDLVQRGNDWFLDGASKMISPGTASVLALYSAAPTVWYGELSSLRSRMGELRLDERKSGGWVRAYGNKYNVAPASGMGYQQLEVKAKPVPRSFTWPLVPKATGTAETVRLALDGIGAPLEYQGQSRRYEIPLAKVVAHAGKIVEVRYRVVAKEGELPSAVRKVNVQAPPTSAYRSPYVQGAGVSGTQVYLSKVGTWTDVLMDPWYLMFPEQKVTIEVSGVLPGSGEVKETLLDGYEVKASDLTAGIKTRLGKAFLQRLVVPSSFTITSKLSFDGGESWRMTRSINLSLFS